MGSLFNEKPRDPTRIDEILGLIKAEWKKDPDLRFFQLIENLQIKYSRNNNGYGSVKDEEGHEGFDYYNLEDEEVIEFLKKK